MFHFLDHTLAVLFCRHANNPPPNIQVSKSCDSLMSSSTSEVCDRKFSLPIKSNNTDLDDDNYIPLVDEVRVSPVVSRKGYLNFLEEKHTGWVKKWVVCERLQIDISTIMLCIDYTT